MQNHANAFPPHWMIVASLPFLSHPISQRRHGGLIRVLVLQARLLSKRLAKKVEVPSFESHSRQDSLDDCQDSCHFSAPQHMQCLCPKGPLMLGPELVYILVRTVRFWISANVILELSHAAYWRKSFDAQRRLQ